MFVLILQQVRLDEVLLQVVCLERLLIQVLLEDLAGLLLQVLGHSHFCSKVLLSSKHKVEGCGVIAVRDIPEGTDPFHICNGHLAGADERSVTVRESEMEHLNPVVKDLVKGFFAPLTDDDEEGDENGSCLINSRFSLLSFALRRSSHFVGFLFIQNDLRYIFS